MNPRMRYENKLANYAAPFIPQCGEGTKEKEALHKLLDHYSDYIYDKTAVIGILKAISSVRYINVGMFRDDEGWEHNEHIFIINGHRFEYKTGVGIDVRPVKYGTNYRNTLEYDRLKLLFDFIYCILQDATYADYTEDNFIEELGYTDTVKDYKRGIKAYREIRENAEKVYKIWGRDVVNNLYEIMQL